MNFLQLGYAREDMTPRILPVSNNSVRYVSEIGTPISASCLAWRFAEETVLQFSLDLRTLYDDDYHRVVRVLSAETGLDEARILLTTTHNHSAPDISMVHREEICAWEKDVALPAMIRAAGRAMADLAFVTEASGGRAKTEKCNFVRRFYRADGTFYSIAAAKSDAPISSHESEADPELRAIKILREGKEPVVLVNYQTHAASGQISHPTQVHADFVGSLRDALEKKGEGHFFYLQGACGNINCNAVLPEDQDGCPGDCFQIGERLAEDVLSALAQKIPYRLDRMELKNQALCCLVNHAKSHLAPEAERIRAIENKEERLLQMRQAGFTSRYELSAVITRSRFPKERNMPLSTLVLGDLSMGFAPVELFDTCGKSFRDAAAGPMTFFVGYTNGSHGYMPSAHSFPNGGYEVLQCHYVAGTGERIVLKLLEMLRDD